VSRKIPDRRFEDLADCAVRVFIERGYRRTQMSDVAEALGVAKGTLYLYVESKEALFDLALRYSDATDRFTKPAVLPVPTPLPGATAAFVRARLTAAGTLPSLAASLERTRVASISTELECIVRELYDLLARNRRGIKLLDRAAPDHPDLAALWFQGGRMGLMASLEEYLGRRIRGRRLRSVPNLAAAARLIIETTVFWAVHRHWDPYPQQIDERMAEETVVRFVVGALCKE